MKKLFLLCFIIFLDTLVASSIFDKSKLDSLLLNNNYKLLKENLFNQKLNEADLNNTLTEHEQYLYHKYLATLKSIDKLETLSEKEVQKAINARMQSVNGMIDYTNNQNFKKAYNNFNNSLTGKNNLRILENYFILNHFYKVGIKENVNELKLLIEKIKFNYSSKEYAVADSLDEILKSETEKSPKLRFLYEDEYLTYLNNVKDTEVLEGLNTKFWSENSKISQRFYFYLGGNFMGSSQIKNSDWQFYYSTSPNKKWNHYDLNILSGFGYSGIIEFSYQLNDNFLFGINYEIGKFSHKNYRYINNITSMEYLVNYQSIQISSEYLFRNAVGLRPYVSLGFGLGFINYENQTIPVFGTDVDGNALSRHLLIKERKTDSSQLIIELGTHYIRKKNDYFITKVYVFSKYNFNSLPILGEFLYGVGAKVGLMF